MNQISRSRELLGLWGHCECQDHKSPDTLTLRLPLKGGVPVELIVIRGAGAVSAGVPEPSPPVVVFDVKADDVLVTVIAGLLQILLELRSRRVAGHGEQHVVDAM